MACEAKGPDVNKKFCASYTHERGKHLDSDHSDDTNYGKYPGTKTRNDAYSRIVENHKDQFFSKTRINNPRGWKSLEKRSLLRTNINKSRITMIQNRRNTVLKLRQLTTLRKTQLNNLLGMRRPKSCSKP
eukprot:7383566-Heterocapsa_arctica.AAC.1